MVVLKRDCFNKKALRDLFHRNNGCIETMVKRKENIVCVGSTETMVVLKLNKTSKRCEMIEVPPKQWLY